MEAFQLEDIVKCRQNQDCTPASGPASGWNAAVWKYKCTYRSVVVN